MNEKTKGLIRAYESQGWKFERTEETKTEDGFLISTDYKMTKICRQAARDPFGGIIEYQDIEHCTVISQFQDGTVEVVRAY